MSARAILTVYILFAFAQTGGTAVENWFLPYKSDDATVLLLHFGEPGHPVNAVAAPLRVRLQGNARLVEGVFGRGVALDGSEGTNLFVEGGEALCFRQDEEFTVELWCRPKSAGESALFSLGTRFYLRIAPAAASATFGYRCAAFPIRWFPLSGVPLRLNHWQHVAVTHDRQQRVSLYVNGNLVDTVTHKREGDYGQAGSISLGSHDGWTDFSGGDMDEVRISRSVRSFRPLLTHSGYLTGEEVGLTVTGAELPREVEQVEIDVADASGKAVVMKRVPKGDLPCGLFAASQLPEGVCMATVSFLDKKGDPLGSVECPVAFVGRRANDIKARIATLRAAASNEALANRARSFHLLMQRVRQLLDERKVEEAAGRLAQVERVAQAMREGESAYRARLRKAVRRLPARSDVRGTMSWTADSGAASAFPWAERLGANELVAGQGEATPEGLRLWKKAGYHTVMLGAVPLNDSAWMKDHPDHAQFGYWVAGPVKAEGDAVTVSVFSPRWGRDSVSTLHDPKRSWRVVDCEAKEALSPEQWQYDSKSGLVTIKPATPGHFYTVYFMLSVAGYGDPLIPQFADHAVLSLDELLKPLAGVLNTYWFDELAYAYPGPVPQGGWDWESYTFSANPQNQAAFTRETGIEFDPRWLVMAPRTIECVPDRRYLRWTAWVHEKVKQWLARASEVCRRYGMKSWVYWGDCHVGIEPYLGSLEAGRIDEIDKPAGDAVTARALASFPGPERRRLRVDWLFSHIAASDQGPAHLMRAWSGARRGLLMRFVHGLYWMPFQNAVNCTDPAVREDVVETIAEISDEFRFIADHLAGEPAYTHDLDVYILNAWGKQYSWRPWGSPILAHLTDMPVRVHFISFLEVERDGIPRDADVVFNYGLPNTSWSGGSFWESERVVKAVEHFVEAGGGFVGLQAPSHCDKPDPHWAMERVLGLTGEATVEYASPSFDQSVLADTTLAAPTHGTGAAVLAKTKGGVQHWLGQDLPAVIGGVAEPVKVSTPPKDSITAFVLRDAEGFLSPGVVARQFGKGRAVYVAGWSGEFAFTQLLRRVMLWAAGKEELLTRLSVNGAEEVFIYAYPKARMIALLNNRPTSAKVLLRCAPVVFNVQPAARCQLADVATGETVWKGSAKGLAKDIRVTVLGSCVRLIRVIAQEE